MRIEYLILIILGLAFYKINIKEYRKKRDRKYFLEDKLKPSSRIITKTGIVAYVNKIDGSNVEIITGSEENPTYMVIDKSYIKDILS